LADYEDPDCCAEQHAMVFKRVLLKKPIVKHGRRVRVKAIYLPSTPAGFNPMHDDTTIQLSDKGGQLFCKTINASHFMKVGKRMVKFWEHGTYAGGLSDGRFTFKKNGTLLFQTVGTKLRLRAIEGRSVKVTVRVGDRCSSSTADVHETRKAVRFP
jgi:hypothetical protein